VRAPGKSVAAQGLIFTEENMSGTTFVTVVDLGCGSAGTVIDWDDGGHWEMLCGDCCEVPTDLQLNLRVGARVYRITMLKARVPTPGGGLDKDDWKTLRPVLHRCVEPTPQLDMLASGYAHATRLFLDKEVGWNSAAGLRAILGSVLFINGPWRNRMIERVVTFCLDVHDAGAWLCLPYWPRNHWHTRLSQEAVCKYEWPTGTRGLFAPALYNYERTIAKGIAYPVNLWWVRARTD